MIVVVQYLSSLRSRPICMNLSYYYVLVLVILPIRRLENNSIYSNNSSTHYSRKSRGKAKGQGTILYLTSSEIWGFSFQIYDIDNDYMK